ncbi:MAG: hypothetical protein ACKPFA_34900 [Dolichospermum sp.]
MILCYGQNYTNNLFMGFFNKIASIYNRVIQSIQDARDVAFNLPAKVEENSRLFKTIFNTTALPDVMRYKNPTPNPRAFSFSKIALPKVSVAIARTF